MKTAIVLSGGGTKGAYEVGCMQAIEELRIPFDIVTGTSIGALNGCMVAQGDYEAMYELWGNLKMEDIIEDGLDLTISIDSLMNQGNMIKPFFKSYIDNKGANVTPLKELTYKLCSEERLQKNHIDFGLVCVEYPNLKPLEITYDEMKGSLPNYLLASSACFPAFPIHEFDGKGYVDGGYYDNLPIHLAFKMGAKQIIAIEVNHDKITHPCYENRPNIKVIRPSAPLGQFLEFNRNILDMRIRMGYLDTMKAFCHLLGNKYTFYIFHNHPHEFSFYQEVLEYEAKINRESIKNKVKLFNPIPLTTIIENKVANPSIQDYFIITAEVVAEIFEINEYKIYDIDEFLLLIQREFYHTLNSSQSMFNNMDISIIRLKDFLSTLSRKEVVCFFYLKAIKNEYYDSNWIYPLFSTELLCAIFLKNINTK